MQVQRVDASVGGRKAIAATADKENESPTTFSSANADGSGEGLHLKKSGVRLTRRDQEAINELRKHLATEMKHSPEPTGPKVSTLTPASESEAEATSNQRLRRISHLSRRTSTPLRELFQQSLAAGAAVPSTLSSSSSSLPTQEQSPLGGAEEVERAVRAVTLQQRVVTGKRKSDAETVLERLAASNEGALDSPGKRRRTSLLPFHSDASQLNNNASRSLTHSHDSPSNGNEESGVKAGDDRRTSDGDGEGDGVPVDGSVMEESVSVLDQGTDISIAAASPAHDQLLPPSLALFDSSSSPSVDSRLDKKSSFLRRTFSMKKIKPATCTANKDPRLVFLRLLVDHDLAVTNALLEAGSEDLAKSVLVLFDGTGQALRLLKSFLARELHTTASEGTLFRGVSIGTRLVSHYMRLHGRAYLQAALAHFFGTLLPKDVRVEVDPNRTSDTVEQGCETLTLLVRALLEAFFSIPQSVPVSIRELFAFLQAEVVTHFPEMKDKVVGGFFFLRFVCPALVSPEQWGLLDATPNPGMRRTLILISKVIQNLANELEFGDKEAYMMPMNAFIQENIPRMKRFLADISAAPVAKPSGTTACEDPSLLWASDEFMKSLFKVLDEVSLHLDLLETNLIAAGHETLAEELQAVARDLPSKDDQIKLAKKRSREQKKMKKEEDKQSLRRVDKDKERGIKDKRHRRSLSDTDLEELAPAIRKSDTPGRRQLNRLLSTSKKLLPKFSSDHDEVHASNPDGNPTPRKFLKARRKASAASSSS